MAKKRKPNAAFMKPMTPSSMLAEVVGSKAIPRTEVTKKLWAYIKRNKLQDTKNRRMINADDALKAVFGGRGKVTMFEMTKLVSKHLKYPPPGISPARAEKNARSPGRLFLRAPAGRYLPACCLYSSIDFFRSRYSSQEKKQSLSRSARCSSAFGRSLTIR